MDPKDNRPLYANPRSDVRGHLSGKFSRVLDVGCDIGLFAQGLKLDGLAKVVEGIEISRAASEAEKSLDRVYRVDLSQSQEGLPLSAYDLILCLDVLEHMQDPWGALERIRSLLAPGGQLVVCLPNVRNFRVILPLLFRGRWEYTPTGLLDITHLRFFTKSTAMGLLAKAGFSVDRLISLGLTRFTKAWWLNLATLGLFSGFLDYQYLIFARPTEPSPAEAAKPQ